MPEIAEGRLIYPCQCKLIYSRLTKLTQPLVARIVHYLRKSLVGKTLKLVRAQDDANVFGKVGTSASEFENALSGKTVIDANQQGKYFW